jgi:hypothetical protein
MAVGSDVRLLVPNSGIQFISRPFDMSQARLERRYVERRTDKESEGDDVPVRLEAAFDPRNPEEPVHVPYDRYDRPYDIDQHRALEPFLGRWVPIPYIVHAAHDMTESQHDPKFRNGPTNWARIRIVQKPSSLSTRRLYTAVFAFDTAVDLDQQRTPEVFTTPRAEHTGPAWEYSFVSRFDLVRWFLHKPAKKEGDEPAHNWGQWVRDWVDRCFRDFNSELRGASNDDEDEGQFEAVARYLAFLELVREVAHPPKVRFIKEDTNTRPVDVELVLDVGNSRTHGILIERLPNQDTIDLATSYTLAIRDLQHPEVLYEGAFESDIELFGAQFGDEDLSWPSGRPRAFFWPSAVRVGPEASHIRQAQEGNEVYSGLSSPKRYLWDVRPRVQEWRFPDKQYVSDNPPIVARRLRNKLNARGDVIGAVMTNRKHYERINGRVDEGGARLMTFSRSSFYSFMIAEIVWQALVQINCPDRREKRQQGSLPRRLTRLILTLPSATPVREQMLMKLRAEAAIELLWDQMDWIKKDKRGGRDDLMPRPVVQVAWDEASCVQTVWLYGEISRKFGGRMDAFFDLKGRRRALPAREGVPGREDRSLRLASVDVGGGTTDLMITTYYPERGVALNPVQNFREGYRVAGDDVLKAVIERLVVPAIEDALEAQGFPEPGQLVRRLFGSDRQNMTELERHARRQFVNRVLRPVGLGLLQAYEQTTVDAPLSVEWRTIGSFFMAEDGGEQKFGVSPRILNYLLTPVREKGVKDFELADVKVAVDFQVIADSARTVLREVFDNISEALHVFDPDVVLLSGRPTRLPVMADMLVERLGIAPDRLVLMHQYSPGSWYPISEGTRGGRIGDPKTTASVGGMLCALSERELTNFTLFTDRLQMKSTANFIGELKNDMFLPDDRVVFDASDLASDSVESMRKEFQFMTKMRLGARQLPYERWAATPLYQVRLERPNSGYRIEPPITVTVQRNLEPLGVELKRPEQVLNAEARKEELKLVRASGALNERIEVNLEPPPDANERNWASMQLEFRTLADEEGYWLDTGILAFP